MLSPCPVKWVRPAKDAIKHVLANRAPRVFPEAAAPGLELTAGFPTPAPASTLEILSQVGIPAPTGPISPRDYAVYLLKVAAEVEHALMVQYLYAAASLNPALDTSPEDYLLKVMRIAVQEMGHLATIQNLLLLTGGRNAVHMQRDGLRQLSELNPIPFVLEPVGLSAVAKFVVAEMPAVIPATKVDQIGRLMAIAKKDSGTVPHRVGAIYSVLRWLFLPAAEANQWLDLTTIFSLPADFHVTDADLTSNGEMDALEARADEWEATAFGIILETPRTCAQAVTAIDLVSAQGEGWDDAQDTHFAEFLELADSVEAGLPAGLVRAIATSPTLAPGTGGERHVLIEDAYTAAWGQVFSLQYSLLVLSICHALVTPRTSDDSSQLRAGLLDLALRGMRRVIMAVSEVLTSLPLRTGETSLAGPAYDLDPEFVGVDDESKMRSRHLDSLDALSKLYERIEKDPEFSTHSGHSTLIANLRTFDKRRRKLFQ